MDINLNDTLVNFEEYCTNDIVSGKARSYRLAIKYLCEFLDIDHIDKDTLRLINNTSNALKEQNNLTYQECLRFLTNRRQSSYLLKGWINAAVAHFNIFLNL